MTNKRRADTVSEQLRRAVRASGKTLYRVAKDTGISYAPLHRFLHGRSGLRMDLLDQLCSYLGLRLTRE
jgi:hypothetical protein